MKIDSGEKEPIITNKRFYTWRNMRADMLTSVLATNMDEDREGAMSAAMLSLGDRTSQELNSGELEQVLIKDERGYVLMIYAGDDAVLTVTAKPNAKLSLIFLDVKRSAENIAELL